MPTEQEINTEEYKANRNAALADDAIPVAPPPTSRGQSAKLLLGIAVVIIVLLIVGVLPRLASNKKLATSSAATADATTTVIAIAAASPSKYSTLSLPGQIEAVDQTAVVARASGYVKSWLVDIGDHVKAGQVLAQIATPDLDQQLDQAQAQLDSSQAAFAQANANISSLRAKLSEARSNMSRANAALDQAKTEYLRSKVAVTHGLDSVAQQQAQLVRAQANLNLAHVTSTRYQAMLSDGAVDRESADQAAATYQTSQADVDALTATLHAAQEDVQADRVAVQSAQANVNAYANAVQSSKSDIDAAVANIQSGQATAEAAADVVRSNKANVARMQVLQSFQNVTAPFAGVITARNIDTGSLISGAGSVTGGGAGIGSGVAGATAAGNAAGGSGSEGSSSSSSGGATSLFSLADLKTMRVYINVPQSDVDAVTVNSPANVYIAQLPNKTFRGTITRTSDALDPVSRTLVTEVRIDNAEDALRPGFFAQVHLRITHPVGSVLIPDSALVTNAQGSQVATITSGSTIHFQPVVLGRDFGKQIEVVSGLNVGQQIVSNPSDGLTEGEKVKVSGS